MRLFFKIIWMTRVLMFFIGMFLFNVCVTLASIIAKILMMGYGTRYGIAVFFSKVFVYIARFACGLKYTVSGLEKLPKTPSVLLSNHQSFWENMFVQVIIPKHSWVIKKELLSIPFFGWCLAMLDPVAVDRRDKNSIKDIIDKGVEKIKKGFWLVIFPEATRLKPHQSRRIKPSGIKVALMAKVPIVIMVHNAGVYWPKGFWIKKSGTIKVKIVDVIYPDQFKDLDVRSLTDKVEKIMNYQKSLLLKKR